jgi:hypothetical protein
VSLVRSLTILGRALVQQHRAAEARPYLAEARTIATAQLPEGHSSRVEIEHVWNEAQ